MEKIVILIIFYTSQIFIIFCFVQLKAAMFNFLAILTNYLQDLIEENRIEFWRALPPVLRVQ